ncbi:MAG: threonylcarbamoyl-AMP synthase [Bacteroidetes bacterium]|nr:MAG: threonylcarbamoyl-AMP synthase [Bacteroidota bacterium]
MQNEIDNTLKILKLGGIILYPTDTVWGIGCDATNHEAVRKIYALKQRVESKSMICLVDDIEMLKKYIEEVPEAAHDIIKKASKPTTIIYDSPIGIAENLVAEDNSLAIRIVSDSFCNALLKKFKKPIVSTSANISNQITPKSFKEISEDILKGVDYVVNLHRKKTADKPSTIIKLKRDGTVTVIRA